MVGYAAARLTHPTDLDNRVRRFTAQGMHQQSRSGGVASGPQPCPASAQHPQRTRVREECEHCPGADQARAAAARMAFSGRP
jgi:hypothetical protein